MKNLTGFAEACYDQNSISELIDALSSPADQTDCDTWKISDETWRECIKDALWSRIVNRDRLPGDDDNDGE